MKIVMSGQSNEMNKVVLVLYKFVLSVNVGVMISGS